MKYTIHNNTIFIKGNGIISHYVITGNTVFKIIEHYSGEQLREKFHTLGTLPINSEAKLLNDLRIKKLI